MILSHSNWEQSALASFRNAFKLFCSFYILSLFLKYRIFFVAVEIRFSLSLCTGYFKMKTIIFCMLTLYLPIFLNSFICVSSWSFKDFPGFTISSATRGGYTSLPIFVPLINFSGLIALLNASSTTLNTSRNDGLLCLILFLSGNVSSILPLNKMLL